MVSGGSWRAEPPPIAGGLNQSQSQSRGRGLEVTVRYRASVSLAEMRRNIKSDLFSKNLKFMLDMMIIS